MANLKRQPLQIRKFRVDPLLSEGLLPVPHEGGDLERKVADALFRVAGMASDYADQEAQRLGQREGEQAGLDGRPRVSISGEAAQQVAASGQPLVSTDPVATDLPAEGRALLNSIAGGESAGKYNVRYTPKGGALFSDLTRHPGIMEPGPHGKSSAAGRYQFTQTTWNRMGGGSFDPENQDRRGWDLAQADYRARTGRALLADLQADGLTPKILSTLAPTWAAFNGDRQSHIATYRDSLTRFAGQGNAAPPPSGAATAGVEPSVQAPKIAVSGGAFRPTGRNTIYGRAFDAAGMRTYLQTLNLEIEQTTDQLYEKFKDDPAKLNEAFADLKSEQLQAHVFPEIAAEYELTFDRAAGRKVMAAQRGLEQRREEENRASYLARTGELETMRARKLAGIDPADPGAAGELAAVDRQLEEHYDAAVAHGILTPSQAELAKQDSRRETAVGFYLKQADNQSVEDIDALRTQMKADFAAGKLDGIDAPGWDALDRGLQERQRQAEGDNRSAEQALRNRAADFLSRAGAGLDIDPAEISRFRLDANTAPGGDAIVRQTLDMIGIATKLRDLPVSEAQKAVADMRAGLNEKSTAAEVATVEAAEQMLAQARQRLATDPLSYGEAMRVIEPTPAMTEAGSAADMAALMAARVTAAEKVSEHFGVAPRYLKAGEAKALETAIRADPDSGAQIAAALVQGAGDRAGVVLAEFGKAAPLVSGAGAILAGGGEASAAADAIAGGSKRPDGKTWPSKGDVERRATGTKHLGEAVNAAARGRVLQMAEYIARKRFFDQGLEPDSPEAEDIYQRALDEAAGAVFAGGVQYGGFIEHGGGWFSSSPRVLVDNAIRTDRFSDVLDAITDEDLAALAAPPAGTRTANRLRQATPILTARGYVFSLGDAGNGMPLLMPDANGEPFTLDLAGMAKVLAPRVPGAFRGY